MFKQIHEKKQSVYQKVVAEIKRSITTGDLKPGDKLPSERELAEILGVSRTSLREALKLLAASGLLTIKHGQGVFVADKDQETLLNRFIEKLFIDKDKIEELFAIRKVLEVEAAVWAAQKGTLEQKEKLRLIVDNALEMINTGEQNMTMLAEHDSKFHNSLAEATNNSVLVKIMHDLLDLLADNRSQAIRVPERPLKSVREHKSVVDAIIASDVEQARERMLVHLNAVEKDVLENLRKSEERESV